MNDERFVLRFAAMTAPLVAEFDDLPGVSFFPRRRIIIDPMSARSRRAIDEPGYDYLPEKLDIDFAFVIDDLRIRKNGRF